jgi:DNA-nicking Smr family endonuclease
MKKKNDSEADALWRHVTRDVTPYGARPQKPKPAAPAAKPVAPRTAAPAAPPKKTGREIDAATARKLKRGQIAPEAELDLHGLSQSRAHAALERFVFSAARRNLRTVRIITGKGKGLEGGVLRRLVPLWLDAPELTPFVLTHLQATPAEGGTGALIVRLRKNKTLSS